jgi:flagellar basal-body rod protein FlgB
MTYEVAPDENAVILEEQMVKASQVQMDFNLLTNLSSKQSGMFRTALGRT